MAQVGADYLSDAEFEEYLDLISDGLTTRQAAKKLNKDRVCVFRWLNTQANDTQRHQYARAITFAADSEAEDAKEVAFDDSLDVGFKDDGTPFVKGENIQRSRLKFDALKWSAGRKNPKKYSEKFDINLGGQEENPVKIDSKIEIVHVKP